MKMLEDDDLDSGRELSIRVMHFQADRQKHTKNQTPRQSALCHAYCHRDVPTDNPWYQKHLFKAVTVGHGIQCSQSSYRKSLGSHRSHRIGG